MIIMMWDVFSYNIVGHINKIHSETYNSFKRKEYCPLSIEIFSYFWWNKCIYPFKDGTELI